MVTLAEACESDGDRPAPPGECRWEGCAGARRPGEDFCDAHVEEAVARLFPSHPLQGQPFPMKVPTDRVVLVGECNPYGNPPEYDLYPSPEGSAGHRLCIEILGLGRREYLARYDRLNLLRALPWSAPRAREAARAVLDRWERVVALGARAAEAFGLPTELYRVHRVGLALVATVPHPSGLSRAWNVPGAAERARATVAELEGMP